MNECMEGNAIASLTLGAVLLLFEIEISINILMCVLLCVFFFYLKQQLEVPYEKRSMSHYIQVAFYIFFF